MFDPLARVTYSLILSVDQEEGRTGQDGEALNRMCNAKALIGHDILEGFLAPSLGVQPAHVA
jgi:hypothetical protein